MSNFRTDLVKVQGAFLLWFSWLQREAHFSTIWRDSYDVHWVMGARVYGGGGLYNYFRYCNLVSTNFSGPLWVRVKVKVRLTFRYFPWNQFGH